MENYKFIQKISENEINQKIKYFFGYEEILEKYGGVAEIIFSEEKKYDKEILDILEISGKILMYGEPGTGKTSIAYMIAYKMLDKYEIESYKVVIPELIESNLGKTTRNMAEAIKRIKSISEDSGMIIILDEIDRISVQRANNDEISELKRTLLELLDFLDNLRHDHSILIIGITNYLKLLDPALIRRFDFLDKIIPSKNELKKQFDFLIEKLQIKLNFKNEEIEEKFFIKYNNCDKIKKLFKKIFIEYKGDKEKIQNKIIEEIGGTK